MLRFLLKLLVVQLCLSATVLALEPQIIDVVYLSQKKAVTAVLSNLDPIIEDEGLQGAVLAIEDNNTTGQFTGQKFVLHEVTIPIDGDIVAAYDKIIASGFKYVVVNLSTETLKKLPIKPLLLFNVGSDDDSLRQNECRTDMLHILPSRAMRADALAQFMLKKRWNKWFLVVGNTKNDALFAQALKRSAKRFGMKIVVEKKWQHTYDARRTAQADIPVFTQVDDYDVLVVADEQGLFGEYLTYRTWLPRPVIGTQGLVATSWHRTHEQWGAVQIQNRFKEQAGRWMQEQDYGAYLAIRSLGEAMTRSQSIELNTVKNYLLSENFVLQGYKGKPLSFRTWNGQLRQPVLLAGARSLIGAMPLDGFLHPTNELDTLGFDKPESTCQWKSE